MRIFYFLILILTICLSCKNPNVDPLPEAQYSKRVSKVMVVSPNDTVIYTPYFGPLYHIDSIEIIRINISIYEPQTQYKFKDLVEFSYENGKVSSRKKSGTWQTTSTEESFFYDGNHRISKYVIAVNSPNYFIPPIKYFFNYHPNGELHYLKNDNNDSLHVYNISPTSRSVKTYFPSPIITPGPDPQPETCIPEISLSINADKSYNFINTSPYGCFPASILGTYSNVKINIPLELWHELKDITNSLYDNGYYPHALPELLFKDMDEYFILEMKNTGLKHEYKVDQFGRLLEIIKKYESQPDADRKILFYY